ncbi:MAG: hypothetical protein VKK59_05255 [Vampirovibrionales bacterium]|nr:hypothetical protein [Vampirovibrionales bacterium]
MPDASAISVISAWSVRHDFGSGASVALLSLASLIALHHLWMLFHAEQGRKRDLIQRVEAPMTDTQVAILICYTQPSELNNLADLLDALEEQAYPVTRATIHIATTEETHADLLQLPLPSNTRLWQHPGFRIEAAQLQGWLVERCLALGGSDLYVFLQPTDIVKPDFLQSVVNRSFDAFVFQGYLASRYRPVSPLEKLLALNTRLQNRLVNAGRFHAGGSAKLMPSGWAIKQELLEMLPYAAGINAAGVQVLDHTAYGLRLALEKFRVAWAPNIVVYQDEYQPASQKLHCLVASALYKSKLWWQFTPLLLWRSLSRLDAEPLLALLNLVEIPAFWVGLGCFSLALLDALPQLSIWGGAITWLILGLSVMVVHAVGLLIARSRLDDIISTIFWTPLLYIAAAVLSPWGLVQCLMARLFRYRQVGYRSKSPLVKRFNEALTPAQPASQANSIEAQTLSSPIASKSSPSHDPLLDTPHDALVGLSPAASSVMSVQALSEPDTRVKWVPVTNGSRQVECQLSASQAQLPDGSHRYSLVLEYKGIAFQTAKYRGLDQAYYELHAKLADRGLTIMTCGSCGYFYNPASDGHLSSSGVCLFGKLSKSVDILSDAVTVTSQACAHHRDITEREFLVRQWQESQAAQGAAS